MTSTPHATMRAIRQETVGGPEVLTLTEVARPEPIPTEILVRVRAAGVNPVDWKCRAGHGPLREPPFTVGWDVSGVVEEIGFGVTRFAVGDEVFGMPWFPREAAAYAEYVTAPSRQFARTPDGLSPHEAGALPLSGLTAWQLLVDTADVRPGQRVLVHAAAGGVGHLAVQIAKSRGAYVLGTARATSHDLLHRVGADELIDYTTTRFEEAVEGVDVVLDLVGGDNGRRSVATLAPGGLLVSVPSGATQEARRAAEAAGVRVKEFLVEPDHTGLDHLADLVGKGGLHVHLTDVLPLDQASAAHALGESGRAAGKVVLTTEG